MADNTEPMSRDALRKEIDKIRQSFISNQKELEAIMAAVDEYVAGVIGEYDSTSIYDLSLSSDRSHRNGVRNTLRMEQRKKAGL